MPLPEPKANEKRAAFIGRCLTNDTITEENPKITDRMKACSAIYADAQDGDGDADADATEKRAGVGEVLKRMTAGHSFCKMEENEDFTFVLGPVLVPESLDKQGDIIAESEIELTAHDYMEDSQRPGLMHQLMLGTRDAQVVESYVLREAITMNDREIKAGTWMLAMRVYNDKLRKMIRDGKLKGYSIGGHGNMTEEAAA